MKRLPHIPVALSPGDTIAIIAPAGGNVDADLFRAGCSILSEMGFVVFERGKNWSCREYLSDSDDGRASEFQRAWNNPEIKAIFALRGGFGSARLLDLLNFESLHSTSKMLVGFSDISILLNNLFEKAGIICLHGPVVSTLSLSDRTTLDRLYQCLSGNWHRDLQEKVEVLRAGPAVAGTLLGGNLSSMVSVIGTRWAVDFSGAILVLEDVNEPEYRLDRLLTQFAQSGYLRHAAGIILGDFSFSAEDDPIAKARRTEWVWRRVLELTESTAIPVWGGFPVGHGRKNLALPIGAHAVMDSSRQLLQFADSRR